MSTEPSRNAEPAPPHSHRPPLDANQRRVLGVLVEKAKTTPDNYPLTLSALVSGCNQKSNRDPQMDLDDDDVLLALDSLRAIGAAREVQGSGRVAKFRHAAYEWMDVNSREAAVMTELLLRGPQTAGEIRSRASRMEPLGDLAAVSEVLDALIHKGLVVPMSPAGRGQTFAHTLYPADEQSRMQKSAAAAASAAPAATGATAAAHAPSPDQLQALQAEIQQLRERVQRLEAALDLQGEP